jgi:hypothetical protein
MPERKTSFLAKRTQCVTHKTFARSGLYRITYTQNQPCSKNNSLKNEPNFQRSSWQIEIEDRLSLRDAGQLEVRANSSLLNETLHLPGIVPAGDRRRMFGGWFGRGHRPSWRGAGFVHRGG